MRHVDLWFAGILLLCLPAACARTSERMVDDSYQSTKDVFIRRSAQSEARFSMSEVPAFYLVAADQSICEVDATQFANSRRGTAARCVWAAP